MAGPGVDSGQTEQEKKIFALASDFRELWENPTTSHRERKRMIRYERRRETRPGNAALAAEPGGVKADRRKTVP